jgi:hypothetical protein
MRATIEEPVIIKKMSVSLQHLSPKDCLQLKNSSFPLSVTLYSEPNFPAVRGFQVYVPQGRKRLEETTDLAEKFGFSHEFTNILLLAQCHGCLYILFSTDGTLYYDLPVFKKTRKTK